MQRRNIVAHGEMEDNILSSAWLKQYIEYISLLMDSIYGAVLDTYYALMIKMEAPNISDSRLKPLVIQLLE